MADTLVDLGYRGVALAKRVKLAQVRPAAAYLETPAPMPVGSTVAIMADDGTSFDAVVTAIHEQVSGSTAVPGMAVAPALGDAAAKTWWSERVTLPAEEPVTERVPRAALAQAVGAAVPAPAPRATAAAADTDVAGASVAAKLVAAARSSSGTRPPPVAPVEDDHSKRTMVMDAVSVEVLAEMSASDSNPRIEDDGKRTEMMASVDLAALGLETSSSGAMAAARPDTVDDEASEPVDESGPGSDKPADRPATSGKRKRKKR